MPMRIKMDPLEEENQPTINEETKFLHLLNAEICRGVGPKCLSFFKHKLVLKLKYSSLILL